MDDLKNQTAGLDLEMRKLLLVKICSGTNEKCDRAKRELDFCMEEDKPAKQQKFDLVSKKKEHYSKRMKDTLAATVDHETEQQPSDPSRNRTTAKQSG